MCIEIWGEENTPCGPCWPGVHEYNATSVQIYMECSNQYIMGQSGPIELLMNSVFCLFEPYGVPIEEHLDTWARIKKISHTLLTACKEKAEMDAKIKNNRGM